MSGPSLHEEIRGLIAQVTPVDASRRNNAAR
jgi:hypothetical protein